MGFCQRAISSRLALHMAWCHELSAIIDAADSPWCEPRPTHASRQHVETLPAAVDKKKYDLEKHVKGRNEPGSGMQQVLEIVAKLHQKVRNLQRVCVGGEGMTLMWSLGCGEAQTLCFLNAGEA